MYIYVYIMHYICVYYVCMYVLIYILYIYIYNTYYISQSSVIRQNIFIEPEGVKIKPESEISSHTTLT